MPTGTGCTGGLVVLTFAIGVGGATGCDSGVKFIDSGVNGAIFPDELRQRTIFANPGIYARDLAALAGHVFYARAPGTTCGAMYRDADLGPRFLVEGSNLATETRADLRFDALLDRGAGVEASYVLVAGALTAQQVVEVTITDSAAVSVPDEAIPTDRLLHLAAQPLPEGYCDRFYVRGVILMTITTRLYEERSAVGTVIGVALGANGKVYAAQSAHAVDHKIGLSLQPIRPDFSSDLRAHAPLSPFLPLDALGEVGPR